MKKKIIIGLVMVFAIMVNLNLNINEDESSAINLKLVNKPAKADFPPDKWCADPWGYGITTIVECTTCANHHWCWIWTGESRCTPG